MNKLRTKNRKIRMKNNILLFIYNEYITNATKNWLVSNASIA